MTADEEKQLEKQAEMIAELAVNPNKVKENEKTMSENTKPSPSPSASSKAPSPSPSAAKTATKAKPKATPKKVEKPAKVFIPPAGTLVTAFRAWRDKKVYIDKQGNYHIKEEGKEKGAFAPWNRDVKKTFATFDDFLTAYKKASKKGLLSDKKTAKKKAAPKAKATPAKKKADATSVKKAKKKATKEEKKTVLALIRRKPMKDAVEEKEVGSRLIRRDTNRELPEAKTYAKKLPEGMDNTFSIGKSFSQETVRELYETGLRAMRGYIIDNCPKIYIVDILLPRHRVPKSRFLIEAVSPDRALTQIRNENEKRVRAKKRPIFKEDDVLKLVVPTFEKSIMEV